MRCNVVSILNQLIGIVLFLFLSRARQASADSVVALTSSNFDDHVGKHELVFLNFYADWCRFSQILAPVFEEAAKSVHELNKEPNKVLFGKVDCDRETSIAAKHRITKYPTLKLVRNGMVMKREYRGQRSAEAMKNYILEMLKDQVVEVPPEAEAQHVEEKKAALLGYFAGKDTEAYATFRRVASDLRDDCNFYFVARSAGNTSVTTPDVIHFKPPRSKFGEKHETYPGALPHLFDELKKWAGEKCIPLVREITFENAEELTEEGLPFLILFHHPDDKESAELYTKVVHEQLKNDKHTINPLIADGVKFAHPLQHLGKTVKDLPLIAIDSFRHMYRFPDFAQLKIPGKLKAFVDDLYSGKLHREFHYGPDPTVGGAETESQSTDPPESTFKNLAPSRQRYTILKDEL